MILNIIVMLVLLVGPWAATLAQVTSAPLDVTAITGQEVTGPVTSWDTPDGPYIVEHLAGPSPTGDLVVFFRSPVIDWSVVNVTALTGQSVAGSVTSWQAQSGPYLVEYLAGPSPTGDLLVFFWSPQADWQVINVTELTGQKVVGPFTSWQAQEGANTVEYLAGASPTGELLVFSRSPNADWQVVNVTESTGQSIAGQVTGKAPNTIYALSPTGELLEFSRSSPTAWQVVNITALTGKTLSSPVATFSTNYVDYVVEHLVGVGTDNKLYEFRKEPPGLNWNANAIDISRMAGGENFAQGRPAVYTYTDGQSVPVAVLGIRNSANALLLYWWTPTRDWQQINLTEISGREIFAQPQGWRRYEGTTLVEHFAAPDADNHLFVFSGYAQPRQLSDRLREPFQSLQASRTNRKILTIFWDWHNPADPALARETIEPVIFGAQNSVRDYFLENSNGYFTIENAGVLGWYDAAKPYDHYVTPDPGDQDGDGWADGHQEKWAEAIRRADADFDFAAHDANADGVLSPAELGIAIVIPQTAPFGTVRPLIGREYPAQEPLVVDGVRVDVVTEFYIGNPPNLGVVAHELSHLLLGAADMYFLDLPDTPDKRWKDIPWDNPFAAGGYSLMDRHLDGNHLDPFHKLKLGWLRPKIIFSDGQYTLQNVEKGHDALILLDPARGADEYFIIENRWGADSYDKQMADPGGLAVWHVIENPALYGTLIPPLPPNAPPSSRQDLWADKWATIAPDDWGRRSVRMIRPLWNTLNDTQALWDGADPATGYDLLPDAAPPLASLRWADGTPSGFALRGIPAAGPQLNLTVDVPGTP